MDGTIESAVFEIRGSEGAWRVIEDGAPGMDYATKEAAFEAAFLAASTAIKQGFEVVITVAGSTAGRSALGERRQRPT